MKSQMDGEQKFWLSFFGLIAAFLIVVVMSCAAIVINDSNKLSELVKSGVNPIAATCAINNKTENQQMCITYILKEKQ